MSEDTAFIETREKESNTNRTCVAECAPFGITKKENKVQTDYLLGNDEHRDQEEGDIYAAHHLGVFHQPNRPQDGFILYAVKTEQNIPLNAF